MLFSRNSIVMYCSINEIYIETGKWYQQDKRLGVCRKARVDSKSNKALERYGFRVGEQMVITPGSKNLATAC